MSPTVVDGLPAHILFVHFVVVMVPLTALAVVAGAVRQRWARRMGVLLPVTALVTLAMVPVTTHAGEWLERRSGHSPLLRRHTELGDTLLPWALGLFLAATVVWWIGRRTAPAVAPDGVDAGSTTDAGPARSGGGWQRAGWVRTVAVVAAVAIGAGAVVDVYRIGESGAKAAWEGTTQSAPASH
ncbi:DUF2231 domain-containing protein [Actinacidiphila acidipaludis]|uniref:DUF2231 domain-containing protein n=1 Tax=Actinacidiphila acidipaludis TaxID=2873382 RepID=A0ABS7QB90_9ACTN|nr:DUF2231 domain-containing protein [Streptomyces acidipaludis]MBY8880408.1 hypothetical protein [Streptomyces acidipaludis]